MSEKRLPRVGEVWWTRNGYQAKAESFDGSSVYPLCAYHEHQNHYRAHTKDGRWSVGQSGSCHDLVLIHKDSSGKVINPVFDPALIGQPDAQGKPAKPPKPDPLAQAIAESRERTKGLEDLQAKLSRQTKDKAEAKALAAEIAALRAKYPIEPKAAKAGRRGK